MSVHDWISFAILALLLGIPTFRLSCWLWRRGTRKNSPIVGEAELLELAWGIIANAGWDASTGTVDEPKGEGWYEAAIRWRDAYHRWLDANRAER